MPYYIKIEKEDLERILENHKHYLYQDCENWQRMRAHLSNVDLSNMDLSGVNLRDANLASANLENSKMAKINLSGADLSNANLENVDLRFARIYGADLTNANLKDANLYYATLTYADLRFANLSNAKLFATNLKSANLSNSSLVYSNLAHAYLKGADLTGADLRYTIIFRTNDIPDNYKGQMLTQDIVGYKKCKHDIIVTLKIPRGAIVFSINGSKCRTNKVIVLDIEDADGNKVDRAISIYKYMSYYVGDEIIDYTFDCQYNIECSNGIHFFTSKEEAMNFHY